MIVYKLKGGEFIGKTNNNNSSKTLSLLDKVNEKSIHITLTNSYNIQQHICILFELIIITV